MRIALVTSADFPDLTDDDRALLQPLQDRGHSAEPAIWSAPKCDWAAYDLIVIRSCWDYHLRLMEFLRWIASLEERNCNLWNPPAMIRWNADKTYLRELGARGVSIVPTLWFEPDSRVDLQYDIRNAGWSKAVIKPRVSATAYRTEVVETEQADAAQELFDDLLHGPGVMVQKFMDSIVTHGEWSLMFFAGRYSHAVLKTPKCGDFRVQHDFGGSSASAVPPDYVIEAAAKSIRTLDSIPLYARVDGLESDGEFMLMEQELIEPALFLDSSPDAADSLAGAIAASAGV